MALALPLDLRSLLLIEMVRLRSNLVAKRDQKPDGAEVHRSIHKNSVKIWQCLKVSFFYMKFWNMYYFRSGLFSRSFNYLLLVITLGPKRLMLKLATGGALASAGSIIKYNFK